MMLHRWHRFQCAITLPLEVEWFQTIFILMIRKQTDETIDYDNSEISIVSVFTK